MIDRWETQLRKGLVELAVLATIARGETYGYRIVEQLGGLDGPGVHREHGVPGADAAGAGRIPGDPDRALTGGAPETVLSPHDGR